MFLSLKSMGHKFLLTCASQFIAELGASLTGFVIGIWVFRQTGSAMNYTIVLAISVFPSILITPWMGAIIDLYDRFKIMVWARLGIVIASSFLGFIVFNGVHHINFIFALNALICTLKVFQGTAYRASISSWVSEDNLGRANGLIQILYISANILGSVLAGFLIPIIGFLGVIIFDILLNFLAFICLFLYHEKVIVSVVSESTKSIVSFKRLWGSFLESLVYLRRSFALTRLLSYFVVENFLMGMMFSLQLPLILSVYSEEVSGIFMICAGIGGLISSLLSLSLNLKFFVRIIVLSDIILGLTIAVGGVDIAVTMTHMKKSPYLLYLCGFYGAATAPLIGMAEQTLWQRNVPNDMQGRIFSFKDAIISLAFPLAALTSGFLCDHVFEPWLMPKGWLANSIGIWLGVGKGHGMAFFALIIGLLLMVLPLIAFSLKVFNRIDSLSEYKPKQL